MQVVWRPERFNKKKFVRVGVCGKCHAAQRKKGWDYGTKGKRIRVKKR